VRLRLFQNYIAQSDILGSYISYVDLYQFIPHSSN
jgi:hypothetical protein